MKLIIFDLDGTLVNSFYPHYLSFKKALEELGIREKFRKIDVYRKFGKCGEEIYKEIIPSLTNSQIKKLMNLKRKYFIENIDRVKLLPHVRRTLEKLSKKYQLVLATGTSRKEIIPLLKKLKLKKYFKLIITGYDVKRPKPAPDILLTICRKMKVKKNECVYIGDSIYDGIAANKAGIPFIGITTGHFKKKELKKYGKVISNLKELLKILGLRSGHFMSS